MGINQLTENVRKTILKEKMKKRKLKNQTVKKKLSDEKFFTVKHTSTKFLTVSSMIKKKELESKKAEKAFDDLEDDLVLCTITEDIESIQKRKKINFINDVKFNKIPLVFLLPMNREIDMMCTINGEGYFSCIKYTWMRDSSDDTGMYDVTDSNKSVQGS